MKKIKLNRNFFLKKKKRWNDRIRKFIYAEIYYKVFFSIFLKSIRKKYFRKLRSDIARSKSKLNKRSKVISLKIRFIKRKNRGSKIKNIFFQKKIKKRKFYSRFKFKE